MAADEMYGFRTFGEAVVAFDGDSEIKQEEESYMCTEYTYVKDFLSKEEADRLQQFVLTLAPVRPRNPRNQKSFIRKVSYGCYSVMPDSRTGMTVHGGGAGWLATAPDEIKALAARLTEYAGVEINYLSLLGYEDEHDHIGWHNHREDRTLKNQAVWVVSVGDVRTLTTRPVGCRDKSQYEELRPAHGSLYVLPHEYNTTHEHAILDSKKPCGLRISINCKHIDDEYLAAHTKKPKVQEPDREPFVREPGPPRIYCQRIGCAYPDDAVNVDRNTIFGNHKKLNGDEWAAEVATLMKSPEFAAQVEALRGHDLLCWCRPDEESNCHARAWLELANAKKS